MKYCSGIRDGGAKIRGFSKNRPGRPISIVKAYICEDLRKMFPVDVKELTLQNRALHARRLQQIKRSIESRDYQIDPTLVANDLIREVFSMQSARRPAEQD